MLSVGLKIGNSLNSSGRWTPALQECCRASGGCCCLSRKINQVLFHRNSVKSPLFWVGWVTGALLLQNLCSAAESWSSKVDRLGRIWEKRHSGIIFLAINLWRDWGISHRNNRMASSACKGISSWKVSVEILKIPIFSESCCRGGCTLWLFRTEEFNTQIFE